jgi:hypothetical protein
LPFAQQVSYVPARRSATIVNPVGEKYQRQTKDRDTRDTLRLTPTSPIPFAYVPRRLEHAMIGRYIAMNCSTSANGLIVDWIDPQAMSIELIPTFGVLNWFLVSS